MPKALSTYLTELCKKAGLSDSDKSVQHLVSLVDASIEVPDDILPKLENDIYSEGAATAKLRKKLHAEALDLTDKQIDAVVKEFGLSDDQVADLKAEEFTPKRIPILVKKIADLEKQKAGAAAPDKKEIQEQINLLKKEKADAEKSYNQKLKEVSDKHEAEVVNMLLSQMGADYKLVLPDTVPSDIRNKTVLESFNRYASEKGAKVIRENGRLKLVSAKDNSDFYDDKQQLLEVKSAMDLALGRDNLLLKNDSGGQGSQGGFTQIPPGGTGKAPINHDALSLIDSQLAGTKG